MDDGDNREILSDEEWESTLEYWVQQGLVERLPGDMIRPTAEGWEDPVINLLWSEIVSDELAALMEKGFIEAFWDEEQGDMVFKATDKARNYFE